MDQAQALGQHQPEGATGRYDCASPEALFGAHYRGLVRALGVWAGDNEAADDAVQDAFAELLVRWKEVGSYDDPVAWVRRVAINRLRNQRRSLLRRVSALLRIPRPEAHESVASVTRLDIAAALDRLPSRQRLAVTLALVADMPIAEVAAAMGISEGSVSQHLHRGKEALRRYLEVP